MNLTSRTRFFLKHALGDKRAVDEISNSAVRTVDVDLSAAQMDALNATPVTVLAAPGAGYIHVLEGALVFVDVGEEVFELGSGTVDLKYTDGSGATALSISNAIVESAADAIAYVQPSSVAAVANAVLVAKASADVTAGDGTLKLRLFYRKLPSTL